MTKEGFEKLQEGYSDTKSWKGYLKLNTQL